MTRRGLRIGRLGAVVALAAAAVISTPLTGAAQAGPSPHRSAAELRAAVGKSLGNTDRLSSGLRMWLAWPPHVTASVRRAVTPSSGTNVDANDPALDLGARPTEG